MIRYANVRKNTKGRKISLDGPKQKKLTFKKGFSRCIAAPLSYVAQQE